MTRVLVDTNILVYSLHKREGEKHDACALLLSKLIDSNELVLSVQNLVELSRVLTEKTFPLLDKDLVRQYIYEFSKSATMIDYDSHTVMDALSTSKEYCIHFFDALLAVTMQENGITEIITENEKDFVKVPWLTVINPFKERG